MVEKPKLKLDLGKLKENKENAGKHTQKRGISSRYRLGNILASARGEPQRRRTPRWKRKPLGQREISARRSEYTMCYQTRVSHAMMNDLILRQKEIRELGLKSVRSSNKKRAGSRRHRKPSPEALQLLHDLKATFVCRGPTGRCFNTIFWKLRKARPYAYMNDSSRQFISWRDFKDIVQNTYYMSQYSDEVLREAYNAIDTDGDGSIDAREMSSFLNREHKKVRPNSKTSRYY